MTTKPAASVQEVTLKPIKDDLNGELSDEIIYDCGFCEKTVKIHEDFRRMCTALSGDFYYCPFCLRHGHNTKNSKHLLILSFRAIIGYYYYHNYADKTFKKLSWSEIHSCILAHRDVGLLNPAFHYDPETYLWFVDFSKVGSGKKRGKKIEIDDVGKTISNILSCFNLDTVLTNADIPMMYGKYVDAIQQFYEQRTRPEDKRMLIPTLSGSSANITANDDFTMEDCRQFTNYDFVLLS